MASLIERVRLETMLTLHKADTLDRCEVPYFGRLASSILDDE
jgi:hypothetical protein